MLYRKEYHFLANELLIYLRKSRSDDPLLTIDEVLAKHEAILKEWQERNIEGLIPEDNYYREVVSGETIKDRPQFQAVLSKIESPKIKGVLIVEPQRLSRGDLEDIGRLMKLFKYSQTLVITPQKIYDLEDEYDWDALERELKRGNEFLEYTKKILNRGRLLSVSQGNYLGTIPPYGYDKYTIIDGKKKCPSLIPNEKEAEAVRMIYDWYVHENMGYQKICQRLNEMGIKPRNGGKYWHAESLQKIIGNYHHVGKVVWNHRKGVKIVEDGEIKRKRPVAKIGEYMVFDGRHPAIVDVDIFKAAREKRGKNPKNKSATNIANPLATLMYCGTCGKAVVLKPYKETGAKVYLCANQINCRSGSATMEEVLDDVCTVLAQCIEDFELRLKNNEGDSVRYHANMVKQLEKRMEELQAKEVRLWEEKVEGTNNMPDHIFQNLRDKILAEKEKVRQALCKAAESVPKPIDYENKLVTFKKALEAIKDPNTEARITNNLLKACIERITYTRKPSLRLSADKYEELGIKPEEIKRGGWYTPPFELEIKLRV